MCTVETHASCRHPVPTGSWLCFFHSFFFFNDPATTEIYTLSLHDALPICQLQRIWLHLTERAIADRRHSRRTSPVRSEERRVGKECRSRWCSYHKKKKHSQSYRPLYKIIFTRKQRLPHSQRQLSTHTQITF